MRPTTFVVAVNDEKLLCRNLLESPCFKQPSKHEIFKQSGFESAAKAYNDALDRASNDLIVFIHQDLFLPDSWMTHLEESLDYLDKVDPEWGVLGCWGATKGGKLCGHIYSTGLGILGESFKAPLEVRTLDEVVLILRKSSGLRFDAGLPHFHFYGADICLTAEKQGRKSYAISAFCVHNTRQLLVLPKEFYQCYSHLWKTRRKDLPIRTTCIEISPLKRGLLERRIREACMCITGKHKMAASRSASAVQIWQELAVSQPELTV